MTPFCMELGFLIFRDKFGFETPKNFAGIVTDRPFAVCTFRQGAFTVTEGLWMCKDWNYSDAIWIIFRKKCFWLTRKQCKKWLNQLKRECSDFRRC